MSNTKQVLSNASRHDAQRIGIKDNKARRKLGFTMVELITVIAIIAAMMGFAFVALTTILKNMQQEELDGNARQIFVVAQNHLSSASSQGILGRITKNYESSAESTVLGVSETNFFQGTGQTAEDGVYYFFVDGDNQSFASTTVLGQMLPNGSIDEMLRKGGTYVIRYNLKTATVLDVFYANLKPTTFLSASTGGVPFEESNEKTQRIYPNFKGTSKKTERQSYEMKDGKKYIIGWCNAESAGADSVEVKPITLTVDNGDRLVATVTHENGAIAKTAGLSIRLVVTGLTSQNTKTITLMDYAKYSEADGGKAYTKDSAGFAYAVETPNDGASKYVVCLDDITTSGLHFAELFSPIDTAGHTGGGLIPGENISVQAFASSSTHLVNVQSSYKLIRNSLFSSVTTDSERGQVARIGSIRHLENLSSEISNYDPSEEGAKAVGLVDPVLPEGEGKYKPVKSWTDFSPESAQQVSDISWKSFRKNIAESRSNDSNPANANNNAASPLTNASNDDEIAAEAEGITVYQYALPSTSAPLIGQGSGIVSNVDTGSYLPVQTTTYNLSYDGASHRVSDIISKRTTGSGNVGMFDTIEEGREVYSVKLVNFDLDNKVGKAGALAGEVKSGAKEVKDVVAFNETEKSGNINDAEYNITASGNAGGLIGSLTGVNLTNCAAAVYVRGGSDAGGLVGNVSGTVAIERCYAGGHTSSGAYKDVVGDGEQGRMNVIGTNAGGLIGNVADSSSLTLKDCYSTASAYSTAATADADGSAGGLIGVVGAKAATTFDNCYTTSFVSGTKNTSGELNSKSIGPLVGSKDDSATITWNGANRYFEIVNQDQKGLNNIGLGDGTTQLILKKEGDDYKAVDPDNQDITNGVLMVDRDTETYAYYVKGNGTGYAHDGTISVYYGNKFPFQTIAEMTTSTETLPDHLNAHYGDWPSLETFVINQAST